MSTNIYDIKEWKTGTEYKTNDIVWYNLSSRKYYWYATVDHSATAGNKPSLANTNWSGVRYDSLKTATNKPYFFWKPSYNFQISSKPRVIVHKYGDGYEQRPTDGIESLLLSGSLSFETRNAKESRAIIHFVTVRKARESFLCMLPPPYNIDKLFIARDWTTAFNFYDNYTVRINLEETTN